MGREDGGRKGKLKGRREEGGGGEGWWMRWYELPIPPPGLISPGGGSTDRWAQLGNFSNCHLINLLTGVGNQARGDNQTFTQVSSAVQRPLGWAYQEKGIVTAYLGLKPVSKLYDSKSD